jgi:hypothetical protein
MNATSEFVLRSSMIGAGATAIIDVWALLLKQFGILSLNLAFLGALGRTSFRRTMET